MDISFKIFNSTDEFLIKQQYNQIIEYISQILINIKSPLKFFGHFFMTLEKEIVFINRSSVWKNNTKMDLGVVYIENNTMTFVIDPKIINDEFATFKILYKVLHEIIHCVFRHKSRQPENLKDALIFQLAADHVTNSVLYELYLNKEVTRVMYFPKNEFFIKRFFEEHKNSSAEEIYQLIKKSDDFVITSKQIKIPLSEYGQTTDEIYVREYLGEDELNTKFDLGLRSLKDTIGLDLSNSPIQSDVDDSNDYLSSGGTLLFKTDEELDSFNEDYDVKAKIQTPDPNKIGDPEFDILDSAVNPSIDQLLRESLEDDEDEDEEYSGVSLSKMANHGSRTIPDYDPMENYFEYIIINVFDKKTRRNYNVLYDLSNFNKSTQEIEHNGPVYFERYKESLQSGIPGIGSSTSNGLSIFDRLFKVKYPWDEVVRNAICTRSIMSEDRSFSKFDNYKNHLGIGIFPGRLEKQIPDALVVGLDSSGSMSDSDLMKTISILCDSYGLYSEIWVFVHDMLVVDTIKIEQTSDKDTIFEHLKEIKGRGGTSHRDVFQKIEELSEEKEISTIIFFTDFCSDVSNVFMNYRFMKFMDTIWCITGESSKSDFTVRLKDVNTTTILVENTIVR